MTLIHPQYRAALEKARNCAKEGEQYGYDNAISTAKDQARKLGYGLDTSALDAEMHKNAYRVKMDAAREAARAGQEHRYAMVKSDAQRNAQAGGFAMEDTSALDAEMRKNARCAR